jgi:uncharacterized protein YkwD
MVSVMRLFVALIRSLSTRLAVGCLAVLLLAIGVTPSQGEEGTGTPLALGYIESEGATGVVEFIAAEPLAGDVVAATVLGVPAEPQGHALVRLTNARRANQGLPPLKAASELMDSAQYHSDWMASHNCFAHSCPGEPTWVQRIVNTGYVNYVLLGENIAGGYPTANEVVQAWMRSSGHKANMLNPDFREAGGGYAYSASSTYHHYWTMDYGARNDAQGYPVYPVVINGEAWSTTSLQVQLYVHGQGWAQQMRFRNEGGTWSGWEPYSCSKAWTLSASGGSPAVVYAQIRRGTTVLQSADDMHLDVQLTVTPRTVVFLWAQGSPATTPGQYAMSIDAVAAWTAIANRSWIRLSQGAGTGPAVVTIYLEGFPTKVGTYSGSISVQSLETAVQIQVTLSVTGEALEEGHVPLMARG